MAREADSKSLQTLSEEMQDLISERSCLLLQRDQAEAWTSHLGLWRSTVVEVTLAQKVMEN